MPRLSHLPRRAVASAGDDAIEFAESIGWSVEAGRGFYVLDEWQKHCIRGILSEDENARLKRLLADAELDKAILKEAASGNF